MPPLYVFMFLIATSLTSCFPNTYRTLQKVDLSLDDSYEIKSIAGCCGCKALFYNVYQNNKLTEQFVVETSCELYEPTKHIFTVNTKGKVTNVKSFVAVTDSSFTTPVTELDKKAFIQLDSIYKNWTSVNKRQIVLAGITGFKEGQKTHVPLGVKIATTTTK